MDDWRVHFSNGFFQMAGCSANIRIIALSGRAYELCASAGFAHMAADLAPLGVPWRLPLAYLADTVTNDIEPAS